LGPDHRDTLDSLDTYAVAMARHAQRAGLPPPDEAIHLLRECLTSRLRTLGPDDPQTLTSNGNLGLELSFRGEWAEAVEMLRQAVTGYEKREISYESFAPAGNLAIALYSLGELEEADLLLARYVPEASNLLTENHFITQNMKGSRARVWIDQGRSDEALADLQVVVKSRRESYPDGSWRIATGLTDLGRAQLLLGQLSEAEASLAEARKIFQTHPPANDYFSAWADCCHAQTLVALHRLDEAEPLLLDAEQRLSTLKACPRRHYEKSLELLMQLYDAREMPEKAQTWRSKLEALREKGNLNVRAG
jgi:tetratricopeptide (TPR) repeat protein